MIETPPEARLPILTRIAEDDDGLVRDAINRELDRGGQVFYVHNRVETIEGAAERVRRLVPRAKVAIGHGQMAEGMLERVMLDYDAGRFDVLVCTTIIESGLDIPNANTIIIARADTLGPGAALPAARTGRPLGPARVRLPAAPARAAALSGRAQAAARHLLRLRPGGRLPDRPLRPRDPRRGQHPGRRAARLHGRGRLRALHPDAGRGGRRGARPGDRAGAGRRAPGPARIGVPARRLHRRCRRQAGGLPPLRRDPPRGRCRGPARRSCATDSARPRSRSRGSSARSRCAWRPSWPACPRCAPSRAGHLQVATLRPCHRRAAL